IHTLSLHDALPISPRILRKPPAQRPGGFCFWERKKMTTPDHYLATVPADKTSLTDDERIENIVPLPPPEHLIRFFPIQGTPVESLISETRRSVRHILHGRGDR